ncbi:hypothetical protein NMG60_11026024 [Bertholletia excelsa]
MSKISISFPKPVLLLTLLIFHSLQHANASRETLEIIIGIGGASPPTLPPPEPRCPPPPPPPCPPPPLPPLQEAIKAISNFKDKIRCDPQNITKTWTGPNLCNDPAAYKGFICARKGRETQQRLAGVSFNGFNFAGRDCKPLDVNDIIGKFPDLVFFHVNSNNFSGSIPTSISVAKLPYLYELDLSNNKLVGNFPMSVLGAKNLTFLDLRFNSLSGPVPPQVFNLDLDVLFLNNNQFSGKIPDNLGKTPVLYLTLAKNWFSGPIPKSIGEAADTLVEVLFLGNQLSECLPYEIGKLKKLTVFDASRNLLTGPIPHSFGCLPKIEQLNLASNKLYGTVPESLCRIKTLYKLTLKDNYFTQVGPECRHLIWTNKLDIGMNCIIDLPNQRSKEDCRNFFSTLKKCPDQKSLTYVPCKLPHSASEEKVSEEEWLAPERAPSPAYAALERPPS